jgi:hypothetical protein
VSTVVDGNVRVSLVSTSNELENPDVNPVVPPEVDEEVSVWLKSALNAFVLEQI